jgi:hypothetical protein
MFAGVTTPANISKSVSIKKNPACYSGVPVKSVLSILQGDDHRSLGTLGALLDGELHLLTFAQGAITLGLNRGVMHEDILAAFNRQETVPFFIVEPLHRTNDTFCHFKKLRSEKKRLNCGFIGAKIAAIPIQVWRRCT